MWPWLWTLTFFCKALTLHPQTYTMPCGPLPDFVSILVVFPLHLSSWNFTERLPMSGGFTLLISGSKFQISRSQCIDSLKYFLRIIAFPNIMKLYTKTPLELRDQKVKGQGHYALIPKIIFVLHCFPFRLKHHETSHTHTPHELRMCPIDVRIWRSKVKVTMLWLLKMFWGHNCFLFTSAIFKLHIQIPSESRICPTDNEVKTWRVWIGCCGGYFSR